MIKKLFEKCIICGQQANLKYNYTDEDGFYCQKYYCDEGHQTLTMDSKKVYPMLDGKII